MTLRNSIGAGFRSAVRLSSSKASHKIHSPKASRSFPFISAQEFLEHSKDPTSTVHFNCQNRHRQLGPIYGESFGPDVCAIFISDSRMCRELFRHESSYPQHAVPHSWRVYNSKYNVKRGLLFLDGEEWWNLRRKMNPLLMKNDAIQEIASFGEPVTTKLLENWRQEMKNQDNSLYEIPNLSMRLHNWSVEVMLAGLFGDLYYSDSTQNLIDIPRLISNVQRMFEYSTKLQVVSSEEAAEKNHPDWLQFKNSADETLSAVHTLTDSLIGQTSSGLLHLMSKIGLTNDEINRLASDFIIAAADTTSYTILWCLHLLASHNQKQEIARSECLSNVENQLDTTRLNYIRWCNKEAMRLFPVAPFITRILDKPLTVEGYQLPAGQLILLSTYVMSRDEKYFPNAEKFLPERWKRLGPRSFCGVSPDATCATLPFGYGIRSCIGKRLAEHLISSFLVKTLKNFQLESLNDKQVEMTMRLIGVPDEKIRIGIKSFV